MDDRLVKRFLTSLAILALTSCGTPSPTGNTGALRLVVPHVGQGSGALVVADAGTNMPVDPLGDIGTIDLELVMADLEMASQAANFGKLALI